MPLQEQTASFTFGQGLDTKTNPNVLPFGKFLSLQNCVFDTLGLLKKRNGFATNLGSTLGSISFLTTFQSNLIGLGSNIQSYSQSLGQMINKGSFPQVQLSVVPVSNALYGYTNCDAAFNNGLVCVTSTQIRSAPQVSAGVPLTWNYSIIEQATGQILSGPIPLVASSGGFQQYSPRAFTVGSNFFVVYDTVNVGNSVSSLVYISIPSANPITPSGPFVISSQCQFFSKMSFDGVVASSNSLYVAYDQSIATRVAGRVISANGSQSAIFNINNLSGAYQVSVCADTTQPQIAVWTSMATGSGTTASVINYTCTDAIGNNLVGPTLVTGSGTVFVNYGPLSVANTTLVAQRGIMTSFVEVNNAYSYDSTVKTNLVYSYSVNQTSGLASPETVVNRGIGLGSKAFIFNSVSYFIGTYKSPYQSTYFLISPFNFNYQLLGQSQIQAKIAYGNGQGYLPTGLPQVTVIGSSSFAPYLIQNTISPVGKLTGVSSQTGIYGTLGINLAQFNFGSNQFSVKEIGQNLVINGGFLGNYDGQQFTENDVFLFPDSVEAVSQPVGGALVNGVTYNYIVTYEWPDNKGNIFRSAPSIPVSVTCTTSQASVIVNVPTLRLSYKNWPYGGINTPVAVKLYRSSTSQPIYYFNQQYVQDTTVLNLDSTQFTDFAADTQILGNQILYTNGGVVEDVNGPACTATATFDSRFWLIDAEDQNLLWFSKQVIENTPVEMSDLFTFYVAPNVGAEGPTGNMKCLAPMDDKLIIFKQSAIYYINGIGPDNTGANNQYSDPIFVTSAVGCVNQNSIVLIPNGLMFQSNKGIWLLGRDLSTQYIGKDVEAYNSNVVLSALTVPQTNQVRFTLNNGVTLLYDYFVNQWGTFNGIPGLSSCLYQNLHTYISGSSSIFQESPGVYSDGTSPTLMSFQTGWFNLSGLQGYTRAYRSYLLGNYYTPHNFTMGIGYDYNPSILQTITVNPTNTVGSGSQVEQWQLNFDKQSCQSFQLTFNEVSSQSAGQGLTISGLDLEFGVKKQYPRNLGASNKTS